MKRIVLWVLVIGLCVAFVGCSDSTVKLDKTETLGSLSYKVNSEWNKNESSDYEGSGTLGVDANYGDALIDIITYTPLDENDVVMPLVILRIRIVGMEWSEDFDSSMKTDMWQTILDGGINDVFEIEKNSIEYGTYFYENDMCKANAEFVSPDIGSLKGKITMIANGDETYAIAMVQSNQMSDSSKALYENLIGGIDITKIKSSSSTSSSSGNSSSSGSSSNDYSPGSDWENYDGDNDGKIDDSEFQDAVGDWMDEHDSGSSSSDYSSGSDWEGYDGDSDGQISDSEFQDAVGDFMDEYGF